MINLSILKKLVLAAILVFSVSCIEKVDTPGQVKLDSTKVEVEDAPTEMAEYFVVLLKRGPKWTAEMTPEIEKVLEGHFANIKKLTKEGKLAVAGPFFGQEGEGALAGLFIFKVDSIEEAIRLAEQDPGVQAGRFTFEAITWYGPKGLTY
ncbi:MAG: hypothetical protein IIC66_08685 [candidate division Zixibacteria bacterium]|nr:hypothetical protein [candidate division Zixibacteria bacterium]